jgi:hypothetical protein
MVGPLGFDINSAAFELASTPLHAAARRGDGALMVFLVRNAGMQLTCRCSLGPTLVPSTSRESSLRNCSPLSFPHALHRHFASAPSPDAGLRCRSPRSSAFLLLSAPCPNARSSRCRSSHPQHLSPFTTLHSKLTLVSSRHHILFFSRRGYPQRRRVTPRLRRAHACTPVRCTNFFCILCML